jgi:hypothetical protein
MPGGGLLGSVADLSTPSFLWSNASHKRTFLILW